MWIFGSQTERKIGARINARPHTKRLACLADQIMRFILAASISVARDAGRVGANCCHAIQ